VAKPNAVLVALTALSVHTEGGSEGKRILARPVIR
jgi:hypothetical protein